MQARMQPRKQRTAPQQNWASSRSSKQRKPSGVTLHQARCCQSLEKLHCRRFLLDWIRNISTMDSETKIKAAAALWTEQASAVKIMISSMRRSNNDLTSAVTSRASRAEKERVKTEGEAKAGDGQGGG